MVRSFRSTLPSASDLLALSAYYRVPPRARLRILHNDEMTLDRVEQVRVETGSDVAIVIDTNPKDVRSADDLASLTTRYPNVRVRDHHGPSFRLKPAGLEDTTARILLNELCDLDSELSTLLRSNRKFVAVTNHGNFDPDGVASWTCLSNPELCLKHGRDLDMGVWHSDHELFGGQVFNDDPDAEALEPYKKLAYTLLQRQVEYNEGLVDEVLAERGIAPDRDNVRSVFSGEDAVYGPAILQNVFETMGRRDIPQILASLPYYLEKAPVTPWWRYYVRLKKCEQVIKEGIRADSLVAYYSYNERPDNSFRINCWLGCGAPAPLAPNVPLMLAFSQRTKQCVLSVPYSTQCAHREVFDLSPIFRAANAIEESAGSKGRWGGRGSVVFRFSPNQEYAVTPDQLLQIVQEAYVAGTISTPRA